MTKKEMHDALITYQIKSYHVTENEDGTVDLLFGEDDPIRRTRQLELENQYLKDQVKLLASIAFGISPEKAEEMVK